VQRFELRFLDRLEPLAARHAKAPMRLVIDPLDAYHQGSIYLGNGGKS
jgi:hypothetical protein